MGKALAIVRHARRGGKVIAMAIDALPLLGATHAAAQKATRPCHGTEIGSERMVVACNERGGAAIEGCMPQIRMQLRAVALNLCSVGVSSWLQRAVAVSPGWTVGAAPLFHLLLLCLYFVSFGIEYDCPQIFLAGDSSASSNPEVLMNLCSGGAKLKRNRKTS
jgi:hypothetical protein